METYADMAQAYEEQGGFEEGTRSLTGATDETDGSDFTPEQLKRMTRRISAEGAPLPGGVRDVNWEAPTSTGLEHSAPIFETEADTKGGVRLTSKGINDNNCHYRSWQEDNGVARTFALKSVVKNVDGETRTVLVSPGASLRHSQGSIMTMMSTDMKAMVRSSPSNSSVGNSDEEDKIDAEKGDATGKISLPKESPAKHSSPVPWHPPADLMSDSAKEKSVAQANSKVGSLTCKGDATEPVHALTTGSTRDISPTPCRPSGSSADCHVQQPRPGRSLSTKGVADDVGVSVLETKHRPVQGTQHPDHETCSSRSGCGLTTVVDGGGCVGASAQGDGPATGNDASITSVETAKVISDGEAGYEAATLGCDQDGQGGGHNERKGVGATDDTRERTSPASSAQEKTTTTKTWWGGSRTRKKGPSPTSLRGPIEEGEEHSGVRSKQGAQQGALPIVCSAAGSSAAPRRRRWFNFRPRNSVTIQASRGASCS